jgi:nuclear pore complex protein Nup205
MLFSGPKDVKDLFSVLKDSASEVSQSNTAIKHQVLLHTLLLGFLVFVLFSVKHYRFGF